jgi:hypothetical protein
VLIRKTIAEVDAGRKGPGSLQEAVELHAGKLTPEEQMKVMKVAQGLDSPDVPYVLLSELGFKSPIPEKVAARISLERDGPNVVSAYRAEKPLNLEPVTPADLKKGLPQDATLYVEDGASFNKNDFQANPGASVAELVQNPEMEVMRVRDAETGAFRPGKVYAKDDAARAVVGGAAQQDSERIYHRLAGPIAAATGAGSMYLIRRRSFDKCDLNKDGKVSEEERRLCKAA